MAKNRNSGPSTSAPKKNVSAATTLARKAKRVLQSNGLHYFKSWAEKPTAGGRRPKSSRGALKTENPALYRQLVSKGVSLDRRMDRPPVPKDAPEPVEAE